MSTRFDPDAALRARYREATAQLSPRVRAQLSQRRLAALRGQPPAAAPHRLRLATAGFAVIGGLVLGLQLLPQSTRPPAAQSAATVSAPASDRGIVAGLPLEQDPDFYAWLGSNDAPQLAME